MRTLPDGATEFVFHAARNLGVSLYTTGFFLVWTAVTVAIWRSRQATFFGIVFGLVDVGIALACFNLWCKSSSVTVNSTGLTVQKRWLFYSRTRRFDAGDILRLETKIGMTSGNNVYLDLRLISKDSADTFAAAKKRFQQTGARPDLQFAMSSPNGFTLASGIPSKQEADWLLREMTRALGRKAEP